MPRGPPLKVPRTADEGTADQNTQGSPDRSSDEERSRRTARRAPEVADPQAGPSEGTVSIRDEPMRPRGGFRNLVTIPYNVSATRAVRLDDCKQIQTLANFVRLTPMNDRFIYQYRIDFEPNIEARQLRRHLFKKGTENIFSKKPGFDGMHDVYCSQRLEQKITSVRIENPLEPGAYVRISINRVSEVDWLSLEMLRVYNTHMKNFLKALGFYQITSTGSWIHSALATPIGNGETLAMVRGFRTAAHVYDGGQILMNLEAVHKLMQRRNVLQIMAEIRNRRPENLQEALRAELVGKLVVTNYNKRVYRIEDVNFSLKPTCTFKDKRDNRDITYKDYFLTRFNETIKDEAQPLLLVIPNNMRRGDREQEQGEIYLIPELCNIAGLTEQQRNDNRLKMDLIRSSQIHPNDRVQQIRMFLKKFHEEFDIRESLKEWGYSYENDAVRLNAHVLPQQPVGFGPVANKPASNWAKVHPDTADFMVTSLAVAPRMPKLAILITRVDFNNKQDILNRLRQGFDKVSLVAGGVRVFDIVEGDTPNCYINALRKLDSDVSAAIVIMHNQNKEKYDSIKKVATVERGLITQVVTARLMTDPKKVGGAATKIAIQLAAKVGGEPWRVELPLKNAMVCGYDTYHDTAKRGRSFGAFLASMNDKYSRWYSKAAAHDRLDEMSSQVAAHFLQALSKYHELNKQYPERVFIYRDGVSEGQLEHVFKVELSTIQEAIKSVDQTIRLTMVVVNKRIGARFYMKTMQGFVNPPPGTVVDHGVTRKERYDFYLVSQSTRHGTVAPTYYNIIQDESGFTPDIHQRMAYKFCLLYYNWTGTVRVPAPCQYAHKLALLCGEHLHNQPNANLDDRLHFL